MTILSADVVCLSLASKFSDMCSSWLPEVIDLDFRCARQAFVLFELLGGIYGCLVDALNLS